MRKIIIIIVCLVVGFVLYTFIVAIYKANFNIDGVLPAKNLSKEKTGFEKTKISTEKLNFNGTKIESGFTNDTTTDENCRENCQSYLEKKKVEIYLIQHINNLIPKTTFSNATLNVVNYTVDTKANIGIVTYSDGNYKYTKDFIYTQDNNGEIFNLTLR